MLKIRNKRETGFELLRIIAMFFIMLVHILNAGGMLANATEQTIIWHKLLYSFFTPAVNVFVLVSAYFMVNSKFKWKKYLNLWCQVAFFSVATYVSSCFINGGFSFISLIERCFPIIRSRYWFFAAYFILMLIAPFLNKMLKNSSRVELYSLSVILFVLAYLYMKQPLGRVFNLGVGYSVFWFICLYIFAGTLRLYPLNIKKRYLILIYFISTLLLWLVNIPQVDSYYFNMIIFNSLDYTSSLVIVASISLLLIFKDINIKNTSVHNIICYIASLTFGVYLVECSALQEFWHFKVLKIQNYYLSPISPVYAVLFSIAKFAICALIELVRKNIVLLARIIIRKIKEKKINKQDIDIETLDKSNQQKIET